MQTSFLKKFGIHLVLWAVVALYFFISPEYVGRFLNQHGKPIQVNANIPAESDRIRFVVEDLLAYTKDGENLYQLYGWALIIPATTSNSGEFIRELALVGDPGNYIFPLRTEYRNPKLPGTLTALNLDFTTLGFSTLIAEDILKPGKYRIGIVFRNTSDGSAYYRDKPISYLVKTPNTLRLEQK